MGFHVACRNQKMAIIHIPRRQASGFWCSIGKIIVQSRTENHLRNSELCLTQCQQNLHWKERNVISQPAVVKWSNSIKVVRSCNPELLRFPWRFATCLELETAISTGILLHVIFEPLIFCGICNMFGARTAHVAWYFATRIHLGLGWFRVGLWLV